MATFEDRIFVSTKDLYSFIVTNKEYAPHYLLGVLNSALISFFYLAQDTIATKDDFRQVTLGGIRQLPIRRIAFTTPAAERERLVDKGRRLYDQFCQKDDYACVLGFVEHHLGGGERPDVETSGYTNEGPHTQRVPGLEHPAREGGLRVTSPPIHGPGNNDAALGTTHGLGTNATEPLAHPVEPHTTTPAPHANITAQQASVAPAPDIVHDLLAFLAEQMIALHKQRQQAGEAFVLDLEGVLDTGAVDKLGRLWTPPASSTMATSATTDAQTVLGSLAQRRITLRDDIGVLNEDQWKWLVKRRLKQVPNFAQVVQVFRDHQPTLAALDQRIAATDRLIDQIVYRLYGLTDAEIALVEGGAVVPGS